MPNIAYSCVVYVDETDQKALDTGLADGANAYKGFFSYTDDQEEIRRRQIEQSAFFEKRGDHGSARSCAISSTRNSCSKRI